MKNNRRSAAALLLAAALPLALSAAAYGDEIQEQFDSAVEAIETDRLRTARDKLEELLAANPSLLRARLELARVHYLSRDYPEARAEAQKVLDDPNTPPAVRTTVLAFLAQISEDEKRNTQRHSWTPSIYAGAMYDSNVNIGPSDIIDIAGTAVAVTDGAEEDDFAGVINPAISHVFNPGITFDAGEHQGNFLWQTDASAYYRGYFDDSDFNLGILTLRTGPAWVVPRHWRASIALQGDQIWFGDESLAFFTTINPGITWALTSNTELTLDGALVDRHYWDNENEGRDGTDKKATATLTRYFNQRKLALQGGVGYWDFNADEERFGYSAPRIFGGIIAEAWTNGVVYARIDYTDYDFDGLETVSVPPNVFTLPRDDDELRYAAGFEHNFRAGGLQGWALQGSWIYTDNDSSIELYEYDRHVVSLGLAKSF